jgi:hypothetical protein
MPSVSLCITVHNAGSFVAPLVSRLRPLVDEVLFWDQGSADDTAARLQECGDLVLTVPFKGFSNLDRISFPRVAACDWIMSCDVRAEPTEGLFEFVAAWRKVPADFVEVFWAKKRLLVDGKEVSGPEPNPYRPVLWRRLNAGGGSTLTYDEPLGDAAPRAQTPFQAWLRDESCLEYHYSYDELLAEYLQVAAAEGQRLLQLPTRERVRQHLIRMAGELGRDVPIALQRPVEVA